MRAELSVVLALKAALPARTVRQLSLVVLSQKPAADTL